MGRVTASEASQSPPHRHIRDKSPYESTGSFFACGTAALPGVGINASPGLPIPQAPPPVARPGAVPPGNPTARTTSSQSRRSTAGNPEGRTISSQSRRSAAGKSHRPHHSSPSRRSAAGNPHRPHQPVARPGVAPPGNPTGPTTSSPSRRSAAGKCCKNNKARDIPGFAHSLAFSNRLSTFAGKALNARSHR